MQHMVRRLVCLATVAGTTLGAFGGTTVYVDGKSTAAAEPYESPETAATTITVAKEYADTLGDEAYPVEIRVAEGTYAESGFVLDKPIAVVGTAGSRAGVIINDNVAGKRAFTISHADARVESLTIQGNGFYNGWSDGGHILMTDGTVSNCVVTGGNFAHYGFGGNVHISGGLLTDCEIANGMIQSYRSLGGNVAVLGGRVARCLIHDGTINANGSGHDDHGANVFACGGVVESCVVTGGRIFTKGGTGDAAGVYASGTAKIVNCIVADNATGVKVGNITGFANSSHNTYKTGSMTPYILNTAFLNNGGTKTSEIGSGDYDRYVNCASDSEALQAEDWQAVDKSMFADFDGGDYRPVKDSSLIDAGTLGGEIFPEGFSATDYHGVPRLSGTAPDIGAGEYESEFAAQLIGRGGIVGQETRFAATSGVSPSKFRWSFGDGSDEVTTKNGEIAHVFAAVGRYVVTVAVSHDGGGTWSAAKRLAHPVLIVPEAVYVDPACATPSAPYGTKESAATTIAEAMSVLSEDPAVVKPVFGTIVIVKGATVSETGFEIRGGITIRGETGNPADAVINDATTGKRAFNLRHADARIESLTIRGAGINSGYVDGGHILMSAGTVSNCVVTGGTISYYGGGGNIHMSGGLVVDSVISNGRNSLYRPLGANIAVVGGCLRRCRITGGTLSSNSGYVGYGAGVLASGGVVESCVIDRNTLQSSGVAGGIYASGTATILNCTVVRNASGIVIGTVVDTDHVNNQFMTDGTHRPTILNTMFYDNGGTEAKEFGTANLDCFTACASSVTNDQCASWHLMGEGDFASYVTDDYALAPSSGLVDAGTEDAELLPAETSDLDYYLSARRSGASLDIGCSEVDQDRLSVFGRMEEESGAEGRTLTFVATVQGEADDVLFKWDFGNGTVITTEDATYRYAYPETGLYTVRVAVSGDGGGTWSDWNELVTHVAIVPEVMFVDSNGTNPTPPYKTPATAATTLRDVFVLMTNNVAGAATVVSGVTVRVAKDSRLSETDFVLGSAVTIRGETGNPADVVLVDPDGSTGLRAFTLEHAGACIEGLTVTGKGGLGDGGRNTHYIYGGHFWIKAGTVRNCIIENGYSPYYCAGGNVYMTGGLVEDCVIRNGASGCYASFGGNVAMAGGRLRRCQVSGGKVTAGQPGLQGRGANISVVGGVVENCIVRGGTVDASSLGGGIYVSGSASIVNCTVVGNTSGIVIGTALRWSDEVVGFVTDNDVKASVVGCVMFGNGGTEAGERGSAFLDHFRRCASSVANEADVNWQVIDETAFNDWSRRDEGLEFLVPNLHPRSPLVGGAETADGYREAGGTSSVDLLGGPRRIGRRLDVGCLEANSAGTVLMVR